MKDLTLQIQDQTINSNTNDDPKNSYQQEERMCSKLS